MHKKLRFYIEYVEFLNQQIIFACQKISNLSIQNLNNFSKFVCATAPYMSAGAKIHCCEEIFANSKKLIKNSASTKQKY